MARVRNLIPSCMMYRTALPLLFGTALAGLYGERNLNHTCTLGQSSCTSALLCHGLSSRTVEPLLSCSRGAQPNLTDSCCVETYGGLVVCLVT